MRKLITTMLAVCALVSAQADHLSNRLTFAAKLSGANEVPAVSTTASGVGAMMLNSTRDTLWVNIAVTGLGNNITGIHIHKGAKGTNGNVVLDLGPKLNKNIVRTFITGSGLTNIWNDLMTDMLYLNVHTTANPNGEIRGQIMLERDYGMGASLDGLQAGNVLVSARGVLNMGINQQMDSMWLNLQTAGLSGKITAVHLHKGALLQSGGVLLGLDEFIRTDSMSLSGGRMITAAERDTLMKYMSMNQVYVNVHTAANPNGEIRGQVAGNDIRFDAVANTAQIISGGGTIGTPSNGWAVGNLSLSNDFTQLTFDFVFDNLSSAATAAHFHNAAPTASGPVVKGLTINGNRISGTWSSTDGTEPLTPALLSQLLEGNIYLVIHTSANGNGELRGNVTRLAREGFILELDGQQASTNAMGMGAGVATYDRARNNLHYMIAVDNLTGAITAAHFHKAVKGQSGGVVYDIGSNFMNNGAYAYWAPFGNANSIPLRTNDSLYVNIHTAAFPNGEVRGQWMRNYRISSETSMPSSINEAKENAFIRSFPNPFNEFITVENTTGNPVTATLLNINGSEIAKQEITSVTSTISLSSVAKGFYILIIRDANGTVLESNKMLK